jgi:hypothetical protein
VLLRRIIICLIDLLIRSWLVDDHSPIVKVVIVKALGTVAVALSQGSVGGEERSSDSSSESMLHGCCCCWVFLGVLVSSLFW